MTPADIQRLANQAARRAGFGRATSVVFDRRRRFGAKVIKRVAPSKGRRAVVVVACPASWREPEVITLPKPRTLISFTSPSRADNRRLARYTRLGRYCGHRLAMRILDGVEPSIESQKLLRRMLETGTLQVDLSRVQKPTELDRELARLVAEVSS